MERLTKLYDDVTELGSRCGIFYCGAIRCGIVRCADAYYVVCDTRKVVLAQCDTQALAWAWMDYYKARFRGVAT